MEYILRHSMQIAIDGINWQERYGGIIMIKMLCENKRDFFIEKKNYCKKVIESLVYGYKNSSENIKNELPINDLFLDWLEKVKNEEYDMAYKKSDKTEYMPREIDNGYILKVLDNYDPTMIKESSYGVYRRLRKAFNVLDNHPKMTIKQLSNSIKIMYLLMKQN